MSIGTNIKKRRYELKMSQQELADAMGYKTRSTITKIENDENGVSSKKLIEFARVLDTTVESLISNTTETKINVANEVSSNGHKNIAIILAGGKSTRNEQNIPNQFINVFGKPVIIYSMEAYQRHPSIDDIYVVCLKGWEDIVDSYAKQFNISKLRKVLPAGESGIISVKLAVDYLSAFCNATDTLIFQESTRPMVNEEIISKLLLHYKENGSATIFEPMSDHVQFIKNTYSIKYVDRNSLVEVQSPEAYKLEDLRKAFTKALKKQQSLIETCCCMFMYDMGYQPSLFEGNHNNIKIIRQEDIAVFSALLKNKESF